MHISFPERRSAPPPSWKALCDHTKHFSLPAERTSTPRHSWKALCDHTKHFFLRNALAEVAQNGRYKTSGLRPSLNAKKTEEPINSTIRAHSALALSFRVDVQSFVIHVRSRRLYLVALSRTLPQLSPA